MRNLRERNCNKIEKKQFREERIESQREREEILHQTFYAYSLAFLELYISNPCFDILFSWAKVYHSRFIFLGAPKY
jgi:hypothetical protein